MGIKCPLCSSELPENSIGHLAVSIHQYVVNECWNNWNGFDEGDKFYLGNRQVEVVKVRKSWNDSLDSDSSAYAHQGDTFDAYVIFKAGEYFFKKSGTGDSYEDVRWDGDFKQVTPKAETRIVYQFEE